MQLNQRGIWEPFTLYLKKWCKYKHLHIIQYNKVFWSIEENSPFWYHHFFEKVQVMTLLIMKIFSITYEELYFVIYLLTISCHWYLSIPAITINNHRFSHVSSEHRKRSVSWNGLLRLNNVLQHHYFNKNLLLLFIDHFRVKC